MLLIIENRREFHTLAQTEPTNRSTELALAHMAWPWPVATVAPAVASSAVCDQPSLPATRSEERH